MNDISVQDETSLTSDGEDTSTEDVDTETGSKTTSNDTVLSKNTIAKFYRHFR